MDDRPDTQNPAQVVREDFIVILSQDVIAAIARRDADDSQANRRELIRILFAAVEGLAWTYRTEIVESARSLDLLTVEEDQAFSEVSYSVTGQGKIASQPRFVPLTAMIRLTTRLASKIDPAFDANFDGIGWDQFGKAVKVRNRITHPKRESDLVISESDTSACISAFYWLFELYSSALESVNSALSQHLMLMREVVQGLREGDPVLHALYKGISRSRPD